MNVHKFNVSELYNFFMSLDVFSIPPPKGKKYFMFLFCTHFVYMLINFYSYFKVPPLNLKLLKIQNMTRKMYAVFYYYSPCH